LKTADAFGGYDRRCRDLPQEEIQRLLEAGTPYVIRQKAPLEGATSFQDAVFGEITIENKEMSFTVCQSAPGQGRACVDAVKALVNGEDLSKVEHAMDNGLYVYVPFEPVTAQTVEQYK
jgi:hypothetical protein